MPPLLQMKFPYRFGFISGLFCGYLFISWTDPKIFSFLFLSGQEKKSSMNICPCRLLCPPGIMLHVPSRALLLLFLTHLSSHFFSFVATLSIDCSHAGVCPSSILWPFLFNIVFSAVSMFWADTQMGVSSALPCWASDWFFSLTTWHRWVLGGSQSFWSQHI